MCNEEFMRIAIQKTREGIESGQTPFGACVVRGQEVIACDHNRVWEETNITSHAEIVAIREACKKLDTVDLSGCTIYTTTEPCPMCFSAIHWAKIDKIIFGTRIRDAQGAGFSELTISNEEMKQQGKSPVIIRGDFMAQECKALFEEFLAKADRRLY